MVINFDVLGGGGGGSYTLPTATASRLGGVKIGSGVTVANDGTISVEGGGYVLPAATQNTLGGVMIGSGVTVDSAGTISVEGYTLPTASTEALGGIKVGSGLTIASDGTLSANGGGADANAQHRFTAATEADMNALTGVSEGDICTVAQHYGDMPEQFYNYLDWGWNVFSALSDLGQNSGITNVKFTLAQSPYYDGQSVGEPEGMINWFYISGETAYYYGFGVNSGDGWYKWDNASDLNDTTSLSVGDYVAINLTELSQGGSNNDSQMIIRPTITQYEYGMLAQCPIPETTYQYNNGEWMKLAPLSFATSAMTKANEAYNMAANKVDKSDPWLSTWSDIAYWGTFIGEVHIDNVSQGYRIHIPYAATERQNPKVTELVTSPSVGYVKTLTQAEYDDLVSGGTVDSQTLYVIIPSNS